MYHRQSFSPERLHFLDARHVAAHRFYAAVSACLFIGFVLSPWTAVASPAQNGAVPAAVLTARKVRPQFSASPSETEIFQSGAFIEPLVPVGSGKASATENAALASATLSFVDRTASGDTSALNGFLDAHPDSPWRASLLTNLGLRYRRSGYYSRALDCWEQAWNLAKNEKGAAAHNLADRALGELLELNSRVGRQEQLKTLLDEAGGRNVQGSVSTQIENAKAALWLMQNRPETSFKCGPYALWRISASQNNRSAANSNLIEDFRSTAQGVSLSQVADLSRSLGMNYQMAKRQPGAAFIVPSVIHWKVGHYAAIVGRVGERYVLEDPTFGQPIQVEEAALNEEASGYFVVPAGALPSGWQSVAESEGDTVWGRGEVGGRDSDPTCGCDAQSGGDGPGGSGGCAGCGEGPGSGPENIAMPGYTVHTMPVSIHLTDSPVGYAPPLGPSIYTTVTYNQLEANQTTTPQYSNFGSLWTFNWLSYVTLDSGTGSGAHIYMRGGGTHNFPTANSTSSGGDAVTYPPNLYGQATLGKTTAGNYEQRMPNGSKEVFNLVDAAGRVFLRQVTDSQGNAVTLYYDADVYTDPQHLPSQPYRLHHITDALGQTTNFFYELTGDPYKITKVTDPFGRSAIFGYTQSAGVYQLTSITDVIGMTSSFTYAGGNFLHLLTTPYGTTTFDNTGVTANASTRVLEITDPLGAKERWENWISSGNGMPYSDPDNVVPRGMYTRNTYLYARSTYYWNKKAMVDDPSHPYTKAHNYHFLHHVGLTDESGILESEKLPLENRLWFTYPGQPYDSSSPPSLTQSTFDQGATKQGTIDRPSAMGRVLDDGTTQLTKYEYNAVGNITKRVLPALSANSGSTVPTDGRITLYDYDAATGMDLLMVRQQTSSSSSVVLEKRVYDPTYPSHRPKQVIDASGQPTTYLYDSQGRLSKTTNAKGESTTYSYTRINQNDGPCDGYLYSVTGAVAGATTSYTYDAAGRKSTSKDSEGYKLIYEYDNLNRLIKTTYPDQPNIANCSYTQTIYNRLDSEWTCDRQGHWTHNFYDALRRLVVVVDPLGRTTNYGYCLCGSLTSVTDPRGNITQWSQDLQGRQTNKTFADGTSIVNTYENSTSRLHSSTDAMQQVKTYTYSVDNKLVQMAYTNCTHATASINIAYDPVYDRISTLEDDATGSIAYTYGNYSAYASYSSWPSTTTTGSGRLTVETKTASTGFSSYTNVYGYDELGRQTSRAVDATNHVASLSYDSLGRITSISTFLGSFGYDYTSNTSLQIASVGLVSPTTGPRTNYTYYPNSGDRRLHTIDNFSPANTVISHFDYSYNADGDLTLWTQQADSNVPSDYHMERDAADQLTASIVKDSSNQSLLKTYAFGYDASANRQSAQLDLAVTTNQFNNLNQITNVNSGGRLRFSGTVNKSATVTVGGNPTTITGNTFVGYANVVSGVNNVVVRAVDVNGSAVTNQYQVQVDSGANQTLAYDLNGNMTNDANGNGYEWDARNRLFAINYSGANARSEFVYDGAGHLARIVEKTNGAISSTKFFVWFDGELNPCEERDGSNSVTKRFFAKGEQIASTNYYYTHDHLGSVREMMDISGTVVGRYSYDPYGTRSNNLVSNGATDSDFAFTSHYFHKPSGLDLTMYRAYNPKYGAWLSRDPAYAESIPSPRGLSLYAYASGNPDDWIDRDGRGLWGAFKCYRIVQKWTNDCLSKLPNCNTACGDTPEHALEALIMCMQDRAARQKVCYDGMLKEMISAGCAAVSVGSAPGYPGWSGGTPYVP